MRLTRLVPVLRSFTMEKNLINLPALLPLLVLDDGVLLPGGVARLETDEAGASMLRAAGAHVAVVARRREVLSVAKDIAGSVQEKVSRAEREHLLRKQLEAIQAELGEDDDGDEAELEKKIEKLGLPAEVLGQVTKELARLRKLPAASPERAVARTWLQWIVDLPWSAQTEDNLEVENARRTLDADHHGLS